MFGELTPKVGEHTSSKSALKGKAMACPLKLLLEND
jgi:hypothetical protein